jgi:hypothetical protein
MVLALSWNYSNLIQIRLLIPAEYYHNLRIAKAHIQRMRLNINISVLCVIVLFSYAGDTKLPFFVDVVYLSLHIFLAYFVFTFVFNWFLGCFLVIAAYDPLDPNGNITIKWDVVSWTPDGYVVSISSLTL